MDEFISKLNIRKYDAELQKLASNFSCGNSFIDNFLKGHIALDYGIGTTYVYLNHSDSIIMGFYNITAGAIEQRDSNGIHRIGGSLHINEFALDSRFHGVIYNDNTGAKLSDALLEDCINRIEYIRKKYVGFSFITLQSTEQGYNLYLRNDFFDIEDDMSLPPNLGKENGCIPMYLPLDLE